MHSLCLTPRKRNKFVFLRKTFSHVSSGSTCWPVFPLCINSRQLQHRNCKEGKCAAPSSALLNASKSLPLQCAFEAAAVHEFAFRDESGERIWQSSSASQRRNLLYSCPRYKIIPVIQEAGWNKYPVRLAKLAAVKTSKLLGGSREVIWILLLREITSTYKDFKLLSTKQIWAIGIWGLLSYFFFFLYFFSQLCKCPE